MDTETSKLLGEIRAFMRESRMSATYFGQLAVGNSRLVSRLEHGRSVELGTAQRIRDFINNQAHRRKAYNLYVSARKRAEKKRNGGKR